MESPWQTSGFVSKREIWDDTFGALSHTHHEGGGFSTDTGALIWDFSGSLEPRD